MSAFELHLWSVCAVVCRLAPVAMLSPLLGGSATPSVVRLSVALALGLFDHLQGGVALDIATETAPGLGLARELALGGLLGLGAMLPLQVARMAGRLLDNARGSVGEEALLGEQGRDSPLAALLHGLFLALYFSSGLHREALRGLLQTFVTTPLGAPLDVELSSGHFVAQVARTFEQALSVGLPGATLVLLVDVALAWAGRAAPQWRLAEHAGTLKPALVGLWVLITLRLLATQVLGQALG